MKLGVPIASFAATLAIAAPAHAAEDPFIGTWRLNLEKSTPQAPDVKGKTFTYSKTADGMVITEVVETASGAKIVYTLPYVYGGKFTPQTASPAYDMLAVEQVDPHTSVGTLKLRGKVVGHSRSTVSADGKTMILTSELTLSNGEVRSQRSVFERQ